MKKYFSLLFFASILSAQSAQTLPSSAQAASYVTNVFRIALQRAPAPAGLAAAVAQLTSGAVTEQQYLYAVLDGPEFKGSASDQAAFAAFVMGAFPAQPIGMSSWSAQPEATWVTASLGQWAAMGP